ncbi:hypothetical protein [Ornithinimicrobium murale]|uniref:hypothetical protein n=1 Tax=Ornithinimicrobium murale TaxID=1050153 RepID=UPI0013B459EA|nr:hypothetical protein [Ornithinimicrobium murale]
MLLAAGCGDRLPPAGEAQSVPQQEQSDTEPATASTTERDAAASETFIDGDAELMFPNQTVEDWAQWGSHVVQVDVVGEKKLLDRATDAGPYNLIPRDVVVDVTNVLWSNPNAITGVTPGEPLTLYTYPGYAQFDDGTEKPAMTEGEARMEIGASYVVVLMDDHQDGEQYLAPMRTMAIDDAGTVLVNKADAPGTTSIKLAALPQSIDSAKVENVVAKPGESVAERWVRYMGLED